MDNRDETERETQISRLLNKVEARKGPPVGMAEEIKANVKAVWLDEINQNNMQDEAQNELARQRWPYALAASITLVIGFGFFNLSNSGDQATSYAMTAKVVNRVEYQTEDDDSWRPLDKMEILGAIKIRTQADSYASIDMRNGMNLRLSENSLVSLDDMSALNLEAGRIYVDSNDNGAHKNSIRILTPFGSAEDIGTQFSVNLLSDRWQILVREGSVRIDNGSDLIADAGEQITISETNQIAKSSLNSDDEIWSWTQKVSSDFKLEGSSLSSYLSWIDRETGKSIEYQSDLARMTATNTILTGSIDGYEPFESLSLVLPTTDFHMQSSDTGKIVIDL